MNPEWRRRHDASEERIKKARDAIAKGNAEMRLALKDRDEILKEFAQWLLEPPRGYIDQPGTFAVVPKEASDE